MDDFWRSLLDSDIRERWGLIITVVFAVLAAGWAIFIRSRKRTPEVKVPSGGRGGNASVRGSGTAMGGRGGWAGDSGNGGDGGHAQVEGSGIAIGGDGGDGSISWRPALGAPSAAERAPADGLESLLPRNEFGLIEAGRGGASGNTNVTIRVKDRDLPFLPMLLLLRLWSPNVLGELDAMHPRNPQDGWDRAKNLYPKLTSAIENHVINCLDVTIPAGLPAPDPYKGPGVCE